MLPTLVNNYPVVLPIEQQMASASEEAELAHLITKAAHLDAAIEKVIELSSEAYAFFRQDETFLTLETDLQNLLQEHQHIQELIDEKRSSKYQKEETEEREHVHKEPETREPTRREKSVLERLYKKISLKTHPDRTKNPELNNLFQVATDLYNNGDINGLEELLDLITAASGKVASTRNKARSYIKKKIEEYRNIVNAKTNHLTFLKMAPGYQLYNIKESNYPDRAVWIANEGLRQNITRLKFAIKQLKNDLEFS